MVGISDYRGRGNDLTYCDEDARDIYDYLVSKGYPAGNIKLLLDKKATSQAIVEAIGWMDKWESADNAPSECVFYFSGHGARYEGYDDGDVEYTDEGIVTTDLILILDGQLRSMFAGYESDRLALIFDTCYSGGMDDLTGDSQGNPVEDGRVVVAACGEDELSYDGTAEQQNGVFTHNYIDGLYSHNAIEEAFAHAQPLAAEQAGNNPVIYDNYPTATDPSQSWIFI